MTLENRFNLLKVLLHKTKDEKIEWENGPLSDSFYSKIGENSVGIRQARDDFHLVIYDIDGNPIEEISDPEFHSEGFTSAFSMMRELFIIAKRNALGTDKIVNNILAELERK